MHAPTRAALDVTPALLCVRGGRVAWLERLPSLSPAYADAAAARRGVDLKDAVVVREGFLCPGMVDTHTVSPDWLWAVQANGSGKGADEVDGEGSCHILTCLVVRGG